MKHNYEVYKIWAPDDALWAQWAKPVLFAQDPPPITPPPAPGGGPTDTAPLADGKTASIIDLPGEAGTLEGLSLAGKGYRPVPLYNGVYTPNEKAMAVNVSNIVAALYRGAQQLQTLPIAKNAPPAFLLDANRLNARARQPGTYDNRWCIFPQDMPSAAFLEEHGIRQIYVRANNIQNDLLHILHRYKEKGLRIYRQNAAGALAELTEAKPSLYRSLLYRFKTMAGLTLNAAGGFGGMLPEATRSSSRHYGIS
ncbi:MAG: hypothetical protein ACK5L3_01355 [Oscillospiraceae bacterium]